MAKAVHLARKDVYHTNANNAHVELREVLKFGRCKSTFEVFAYFDHKKAFEDAPSRIKVRHRSVFFPFWNANNDKFEPIEVVCLSTRDKTDLRKCDQMAGSVCQYLAIFNNDNFPNSIKICQSKLNILPKCKINLKKLMNTFKMLPKRWNLA